MVMRKIKIRSEDTVVVNASGMWCQVVWLMGTNVLEKPPASIIWAEVVTSNISLPLLQVCFPWNFRTQILHAFLTATMHGTCPTYITFLHSKNITKREHIMNLLNV